MEHIVESDNNGTAVLGHVSHTHIHTKNTIVWTAARHRAECQRYLEKSKLIVVGGWLYVLPGVNEDGTTKEECMSIWLALGNT